MKIYFRFMICMSAFIFISLSGFAMDQQQELSDLAKRNKPISVACVGDSITAGSFPGKLSKMLGENWKVHNFGVPGATLMNKANKPYQQQKLGKAALASKADAV